MSRANKLKKDQQSRREKLHDLILWGNLALGRFFARAWRTLVLFLWCVCRIWRPMLEVGTFAGIAYLVYDTYYQTEATISSPASDPQDVFYFPFLFTNNSHIFYLKDINWTCRIERMVTDRQGILLDNRVSTGAQNEIQPGGSLNLSCRGFRASGKVTEATIVIETSYNTRVFGINLPRRPLPIRFTWAGGASNPQWIKGDFPRR
jgi:hypothetical protein